MKGLRRSRSGSGSDLAPPPDAADSPPVPAIRRRRRRRRLLIAAPFLVLLSWAIVSYTVWMVQPTSLPWSVRSVEWVRQDMPLGNWMVDNGERVKYTLNAT